MKVTITGKNFNTYQHLEDTIEKKLEKLDKYFSEDIAHCGRFTGVSI